MGQKLPPHDMELHHRCDEVLHYIWDPIGVAGAPGARDEYYSYLPKVFSLVKDDASADKIAAYLNWVAQERMGLQPSQEQTDRAVASMIEWRDWIRQSRQK